MTDPAELPSGTLVDGRYRVVRVIGVGGTGIVYEVEHTLTSQRLALKTLLDPLHAPRLEQEARALARLRSAHVVKVMDLGRWAPPGAGDSPFMVMNLLTGRNLREVLESKIKLSLPFLANMLVQICSGLDEAHRAGLIHRDLKPDNIHLAGDPGDNEPPADLTHTTVFDFGVVKIAASEANNPLTRTGSTVGTPYYMSLEQLRGSGTVDAQTDVYALSVVLYECFAGKRPFEAGTLGDLIFAICSTNPEPLHTLRPDLPKDVADAVMRGLAREKSDRPKDMRELARTFAPYADAAFTLWLREAAPAPTSPLAQPMVPRDLEPLPPPPAPAFPIAPPGPPTSELPAAQPTLTQPATPSPSSTPDVSGKAGAPLPPVAPPKPLSPPGPPKPLTPPPRIPIARPTRKLSKEDSDALVAQSAAIQAKAASIPAPVFGAKPAAEGAAPEAPMSARPKIDLPKVGNDELTSTTTAIQPEPLEAKPTLAGASLGALPDVPAMKPEAPAPTGDRDTPTEMFMPRLHGGDDAEPARPRALSPEDKTAILNVAELTHGGGPIPIDASPIPPPAPSFGALPVPVPPPPPSSSGVGYPPSSRQLSMSGAELPLVQVPSGRPSPSRPPPADKPTALGTMATLLSPEAQVKVRKQWEALQAAVKALATKVLYRFRSASQEQQVVIVVVGTAMFAIVFVLAVYLIVL